METVIRDVRDLNQGDRSALERVVGHQLGESQRLVIQVMSLAVPATSGRGNGALPEWCNVYEGLTDEQIDEIDRSIVRSRSSRDIS